MSSSLVVLVPQVGRQICHPATWTPCRNRYASLPDDVFAPLGVLVVPRMGLRPLKLRSFTIRCSNAITGDSSEFHDEACPANPERGLRPGKRTFEDVLKRHCLVTRQFERWGRNSRPLLSVTASFCWLSSATASSCCASSRPVFQQLFCVPVSGCELFAQVRDIALCASLFFFRDFFKTLFSSFRPSMAEGCLLSMISRRFSISCSAERACDFLYFAYLSLGLGLPFTADCSCCAPAASLPVH